MAILPDGTVFEASLHSGFPATPYCIWPRGAAFDLAARPVEKSSKAAVKRYRKTKQRRAVTRRLTAGSLPTKEDKAAMPKKAQPVIKKAAKPKPANTHRKASGLTAAAKVLAQEGKPMTCRQITAQIISAGLWTTNGKTPHATIYSAMLREIDDKPGESRFVKTGRGLFGLAERNK